MRVLAIGLGGAGCRVVDHLYDHDMRSKVGCLSPIAIDTDVNTLLQLRYLPDTAKVHFPPIDPDQHYDARSTVDIEEVMTIIQKTDTVEIDAIMIFCGLGGSMVDALSLIVPELRKSFIEPVFGVVTLPCLIEGNRQSAKAAYDIDMVKGYVDATILFDNETWYRRIKDSFEEGEEHEGRARFSQSAKTMPSNPRDIYRLLNERIARQVGLLLRAGEFNEEGLEVSEVVLDAGEILNTLKGNGLVAVGYATEPLPRSLLGVFDRWRSSRYFFEGAQVRAARIVSLAKQAVYEDISIPCDLTSADKALVLIAGPSKELSMKGFQTVRKWIDRSIAGLEMRSGDYPVKNTRFVGIIVMLSGLDNVPRIEEIKEIREGYQIEQELEERRRKEEMLIADNITLDPVEERVPEGRFAGSPIYDVSRAAAAEEPAMKDEMITVVSKKKQSHAHKNPLGDDAILLSSNTGSEDDDDRISLPKKPDAVILDMTRQTSGGARMAPKDSALGVRETRYGMGMPRGDKHMESGLSVKNPPKPKDGIIDGERIVIHAERPPSSAGIIDGESVKIQSPGKKIHELIRDDETVRLKGHTSGAKDGMLGHAERTLSSKGSKAKEPELAKRRLDIIYEAEEEFVPKKPEKTEPEEKEDEDIIFWIK
jgi:cell division GTPase FtsZ